MAKSSSNNTTLFPNENTPSVEQTLSLLRLQSPRLLDQVDFPDIRRALDASDQLDEDLLAGLDAYYRCRTRLVLQHPYIHEQQEQFLNHMTLQLGYPYCNELPQTTRRYDIRWETLCDLVADQLTVGQHLELDSLLKRKYIRDILNMVKAGADADCAISPTQLAAKLGLSPTHASNLISSLWQAGLVVRCRRGRRFELQLTPRALQQVAQWLEETPTPDQQAPSSSVPAATKAKAKPTRQPAKQQAQNVQAGSCLQEAALGS